MWSGYSRVSPVWPLPASLKPSLLPSVGSLPSTYKHVPCRPIPATPSHPSKACSHGLPWLPSHTPLSPSTEVLILTIPGKGLCRGDYTPPSYQISGPTGSLMSLPTSRQHLPHLPGDTSLSGHSPTSLAVHSMALVREALPDPLYRSPSLFCFTLFPNTHIL